MKQTKNMETYQYKITVTLPPRNILQLQLRS